MTLKITKDKYEQQAVGLRDQLEMITRAHDDLSKRKQQEQEMLQRDLN
jgi:hypothetical protein